MRKRYSFDTLNQQTPDYYHYFDCPEDIFEKYSTVITRLLNGELTGVGFRQKKASVGSYKIFTISTSRGGRLIMTDFSDVNGKNVLLFLEDLPTHKYEHALFNKDPAATLRRIETHRQTVNNSTQLNEEAGSSSSSCDQSNASAKIWWFNGHKITPNAEQERAVNSIADNSSRQFVAKLCKGAAGTGKTSTAFAYAKEAQKKYGVEAKILFTAASPLLIEEIQRNWNDIETISSCDGAQVEIMTLQQWLLESNPELNGKDITIVGLNEFKDWYQKTNKTVPAGKLGDANLVYEELSIISAYSYDDYMSLGQNQSLFQDLSERKALWQLRNKWRAYLSKQGWTDLASVDTSHSKIYDCVIVDETQDIPLGILAGLLKACTKEGIPNFFMAGDPLQRLNGYLSPFPFIEQYIYKTGGKDAVDELYINLPCDSYRVFPQARPLNNQAIEYRKILGGVSDKHETVQLPLAYRGDAETTPGRVNWFDSISEPVLENIRQITTNIDETLAVLVITLPGYIKEAKALFKTANVMTVEQCKGLERQIVICYRILEDNDLVKASLILEKNIKTSSASSSSSSSSGRAHFSKKGQDKNYHLIPAFNRLIVAFTRATSCLIVFNPPPKSKQVQRNLSYLSAGLKKTVCEPGTWEKLSVNSDECNNHNQYISHLIKLGHGQLAQQIWCETLKRESADFADFANSLKPRPHANHLNTLLPISSSEAASSVPPSVKKESVPARMPTKVMAKKGKVNQQINNRIMELFENKQELFFNAFYDKNSLEKVRYLLIKPHDIRAFISLEDLCKPIKYLTNAKRQSLLHFLCSNSEESVNFLVDILAVNQSLKDNLVRHISALPEKLPTEKSTQPLYWCSLVCKPETLPLIRLLSAWCNKDPNALNQKLIIDVPPAIYDVIKRMRQAQYNEWPEIINATETKLIENGTILKFYEKEIKRKDQKAFGWLKSFAQSQQPGDSGCPLERCFGFFRFMNERITNSLLLSGKTSKFEELFTSYMREINDLICASQYSCYQKGRIIMMSWIKEKKNSQDIDVFSQVQSILSMLEMVYSIEYHYIEALTHSDQISWRYNEESFTENYKEAGVLNLVTETSYAYDEILLLSEGTIPQKNNIYLHAKDRKIFYTFLTEKKSLIDIEVPGLTAPDPFSMETLAPFIDSLLSIMHKFGHLERTKATPFTKKWINEELEKITQTNKVAMSFIEGKFKGRSQAESDKHITTYEAFEKEPIKVLLILLEAYLNQVYEDEVVSKLEDWPEIKNLICALNDIPEFSSPKHAGQSVEYLQRILQEAECIHKAIIMIEEALDDKLSVTAEHSAFFRVMNSKLKNLYIAKIVTDIEFKSILSNYDTSQPDINKTISSSSSSSSPSSLTSRTLFRHKQPGSCGKKSVVRTPGYSAKQTHSPKFTLLINRFKEHKRFIPYTPAFKSYLSAELLNIKFEKHCRTQLGHVLSSSDSTGFMISLLFLYPDIHTKLSFDLMLQQLGSGNLYFDSLLSWFCMLNHEKRHMLLFEIITNAKSTFFEGLLMILRNAPGNLSNMPELYHLINLELTTFGQMILKKLNEQHRTTAIDNIVNFLVDTQLEETKDFIKTLTRSNSAIWRHHLDLCMAGLPDDNVDSKNKLIFMFHFIDSLDQRALRFLQSIKPEENLAYVQNALSLIKDEYRKNQRQNFGSTEINNWSMQLYTRYKLLQNKSFESIINWLDLELSNDSIPFTELSKGVLRILKEDVELMAENTLQSQEIADTECSASADQVSRP